MLSCTQLAPAWQTGQVGESSSTRRGDPAYRLNAAFSSLTEWRSRRRFVEAGDCGPVGLEDVVVGAGEPVHAASATQTAIAGTIRLMTPSRVNPRGLFGGSLPPRHREETDDPDHVRDHYQQ